MTIQVSRVTKPPINHLKFCCFLYCCLLSCFHFYLTALAHSVIYLWWVIAMAVFYAMCNGWNRVEWTPPFMRILYVFVCRKCKTVMCANNTCEWIASKTNTEREMKYKTDASKLSMICWRKRKTNLINELEDIETVWMKATYWMAKMKMNEWAVDQRP